MCKKFWDNSKNPLRSSIRTLEIGDELIIKNKPIKMQLSAIRVTASTVSTDMGRKYSVNKSGDIVSVKRIS